MVHQRGWFMIALGILIGIFASTVVVSAAPAEGYWKLVKTTFEGPKEWEDDPWSGGIVSWSEVSIRRFTSCRSVTPPSRYEAGAQWTKLPAVLAPGDVFTITVTLRNYVERSKFNEDFGVIVAVYPQGSAGQRIRLGVMSINKGEDAKTETFETKAPGAGSAANKTWHFVITAHQNTIRAVYDWVEGPPPEIRPEPLPEKPKPPKDEKPPSIGALQPPGTIVKGKGRQIRGEAGRDGKITCAGFVLQSRAVIEAVSTGNGEIRFRRTGPAGVNRLGAGFWIQPKGGSQIVFHESNLPQLVTGFVVQPGDYCAYPNLPPGVNDIELEIEFRILAPGETFGPGLGGPPPGTLIDGKGTQTRGKGRDGTIGGVAFTLTRRGVIYMVQSGGAGVDFLLGAPPGRNRLGAGFWIQPMGGTPIAFHPPDLPALAAGYVLPPGVYSAYPDLPPDKDAAEVAIQVKLLADDEDMSEYSLSGTWRCDDGGTYIIRQDGAKVTWQGASADGGKTWTHKFEGKIEGDRIVGYFRDIPPGTMRGEGALTVRIVNMKRLEKFASGKPFGGTVWSR